MRRVLLSPGAFRSTLHQCFSSRSASSSATGPSRPSKQDRGADREEASQPSLVERFRLLGFVETEAVPEVSAAGPPTGARQSKEAAPLCDGSNPLNTHGTHTLPSLAAGRSHVTGPVLTAMSPAALSWLRRRSPLREAELRRLFRQRQIRLLDVSGNVTRARQATVLQPKDRLLFPSDQHSQVVAEDRAASSPPSTRAPPQYAAQASWVLSWHPELLFLNKPAGLQVHGLKAGEVAGPVRHQPGPFPYTLTDVLKSGLGVDPPNTLR
jgi:hypothetical protein